MWPKSLVDFDDPAAKMIMPDAIDDRPPGQWVVAVDDPFGQRRPAAGFIVRMDPVQSPRGHGEGK